MSLSSTVLKEREKEASRVKSFLAFGLVGSLALHVVLIFLGFGNLFLRATASEKEPMEVTLLETPIEEVVKPLEEKKQETEKEPDLSSEVIPLSKSEVVTSATVPIKIPIVEEKPTIVHSSVHQFVARQPERNIPVTQKSERVRHFNPVTTHSQEVAAKPKVSERDAQTHHASVTSNFSSTTASTEGGGGGGGGGGGTSTLTSGDRSVSDGVVSGSGNGLGTGNGTGIGAGVGGGSGSGIGSGSGSGVGSGSGSGIGSGTGGGIGTGIGTGVGSGKGSGNGTEVARKSSGSGDGRAACYKCDLKYPEQARRRGVEGRVEVSVDADADGRVTNVTLKRSSGNSDLDEATLRQAREWRLEPSSNGRKGVTIGSKYAIKGSQYERSHQARRKRRQVVANNPVTAPSTPQTASNSTPHVRRKRRQVVANNTVTAASTPQTASKSTPHARRKRRQVVANNSVTAPSTSQNVSQTPPRARRKRRQVVINNPVTAPSIPSPSSTEQAQ